MEKRGCTRLNGITVDTELAVASNHCPDGDKAPFVIDTTSATIERNDDGEVFSLLSLASYIVGLCCCALLYAPVEDGTTTTGADR